MQSILLFFDFSTGEILLVLIVAFVVFGPSRIPEIARKVGKGMNEIRRASDEIKREITKETSKIKEEINVDNSQFDSIKNTTDEIKDGIKKMGKGLETKIDSPGTKPGDDVAG